MSLTTFLIVSSFLGAIADGVHYGYSAWSQPVFVFLVSAFFCIGFVKVLWEAFK